VEINWKSILRVRKEMGDEQGLLLLKTKQKLTIEQLENATPPDHGENPTNGSWFQAPRGWMLFVEGMPHEVDAWIELLASTLAENGIDGSLDGGSSASSPRWAMYVNSFPALSANFGFTAAPNWTHDAWSGHSEDLPQLIDLGIGWLTALGDPLQTLIDTTAAFWTSPEATAQLVKSEVLLRRTAYAYSYHDGDPQERKLSLSLPNQASITTHGEQLAWQSTVTELRNILLAAPLDRLAQAHIAHLDWSGLLLGAPHAGDDYYHNLAYRNHPEAWAHFTLDPNGIQILSDTHLERANDLSDWETTKLDAHHYLVQARDLEPWYGTPRRREDPLDPDLLNKARADFGDIILTRGTAEALGLNIKQSRWTPPATW
jgi:hypothetical protein